MSGPLLAAGAALLALVAVRDLAGATAVSRAARLSGGWRIPEVLTPLLPAETSLRLERAGLGSTLTPGAVLAGKLGCAGLGAFASPAFAGGAPERLAPLVLLAGPVGGFLLPDLLIARRARRRRAAMLAALPDALDLLGVGVASGRAPERVLAEIAAATAGPLSQELEITLAEIECGTGRPEAMAGLAHRVPGPEIAGLVASLERARGLGSPLAADLHDRAATLRREARGRLEERAARAAPKIQLVVALLLVPSVMLMLLAALIAHSGALFPGA